MTIEIDYDTVSFELDVKCSSTTIQNNLEAEIKGNNGKRITEWFEIFLRRLKEELNYEAFKVEIVGCDLYEVDYIEKLVTDESDVKIEFKKNVDSREIHKKYKAIDDFLQYAEKSTNEIVKNALLLDNIENIKRFRSTVIEVPVIATMSSGKSTLLNALIGQNLLPSKNKATTATTCQIKINNKLKYFKGIVKDTNKIIIKRANRIDGRFIRDWNTKADENPNIRINIEGPVNNLDCNEFDLVLVDTPGPNNSQNLEHSRTIYEYIKNKQQLPIILFVLNAQQLAIDDEKNMLEEIKNVVEENSDSLDRILFILNRIDENKVYDKEDPEPIEDTINQVKKYLSNFGINNPKIFPVSAEYAKLSQLELDPDEDEDRIDSLNKLRKKIKPNEKRPGYQLLEHASLTTSQKVQLNVSIDDDKGADLVYSGLAALKLYIEDYIINHHKKNQYKELYVIANKAYEEISASIKNTRDGISVDTDEKRTKKEEDKKKAIADIEKKQAIINKKIDSLPSIEPPFNNEEIKITKEGVEIQNKIDKAGRPTPEVANKLSEEIRELLLNTTISIETTLEAIRKNALNDRINDLKSISSDFFKMETKDVAVNLFNAKVLNHISTINLGNLDEFTRTVKVSETKTEAKTFLGYKSIFWVSLGTKQVEYYKDKDVVHMDEFYNKKIQPVLNDLSNRVKDFKRKFTEDIKNIDNIFKHKTNKFSDNSIVEVFRNTDELLKLDKKQKTKKLIALTRLESDIIKRYKQ